VNAELQALAGLPVVNWRRGAHNYGIGEGNCFFEALARILDAVSRGEFNGFVTLRAENSHQFNPFLGD